MKTLYRLALLGAMLFQALSPAGAAAAQLPDSPRLHLLADYGWRFYKGDQSSASQPGFDDRQWRDVDLPHDWSIEGPINQQAPAGGAGAYLPTGIGWYRRHFKAPTSWRRHVISVEFDGVYMQSDVWLNGHHLGHRPYGFIGFVYDLTPFLRYGGSNVIAVRVDNSLQPNCRWYSGSGIDRHVWITVTDPVHVAHWGTYVTTPAIAKDSALVHVRTTVANALPARSAATLTSTVLDPNGLTVASAEATSNIAAGGAASFEQDLSVSSPKLWSIDSPALYRLHTQLTVSGRIVDEYDTPFGIRSIDYDVDKGFMLNGLPVKIHGMCLHEDGGSVGAAVPEGVWERRLRLLKAMGCNAIRCSHNPPSPEFLALCDRLGLVVMDEAFDEWSIPKFNNPHGYSLLFKDWSIRDLTDMLHRDRNHPCVVLWSVGNEIPEQLSPTGADVLQPLVTTCHAEDPTRPVTAACDDVHTGNGDASLNFLNQLDIVGYNYVDRWDTRQETYYAEDRQKYPSRKFIGTEDSPIGGVRGAYSFRAMGRDGLVRADYESTMINTEGLLKFDQIYDYVIGEFFWTGIDYLGEAHWPGRSSSSGALDTCGFPKDGYYFFQSRWTTAPMLHLFPHWNWSGREGQVIPVICYTNCSSVELFLNGKSMGVKSLDYPRFGFIGNWQRLSQPAAATTADLHLEWDVPYELGVLKAVGYQNGKQVCEQEICTAGAPFAVVLKADKSTLTADRRDVAHLSVSIVDAKGNVVPDADNSVTFDVSGAARLIGTDSGDPRSHADFQAHTVTVFHGQCLAILQATDKPGGVSITAHVDGLRPASVTLLSSPPTVFTPLLP